MNPFKVTALESLPPLPRESSRFITGFLPEDHPIVRPASRDFPVDKNGRKYLDFDNYGRGLLLGELIQVNEDMEPYEGDNPDEEDMKWQSAAAFRHLNAFLSDLAVSFPEEAELPDLKGKMRRAEAFPIINYKLFDAKHVLYYPDQQNPAFKEYQRDLARYNDLAAKGDPVPAELVAKLDYVAENLFLGEENERVRTEYMSDTVQFLLQSEVVRLAILQIFFSTEEINRILGIEGREQEDNAPTSEQAKARLYPNSKDMDQNKQWGMPKFVADNFGRAIRVANREAAMQQYIASSPNPRSRLPNFKFTNKKSQTETEFVFDKDKVAVKSAEQFADQLIKIKDAKVLQTFFALMKWATIQDTIVFRDVPISEIMGLVLKSNGESKFNTPQRREFSEVLEYLSTISITESIIGERINKKTGKARPELREEKGIKIFRLEATYSVKREFQSLPKDELDRDLHFDKTVITRFSGALMPDKPYLFATRASVYFDSLLHLDANKDSKAILLGFHIQTRFNQNQDKEQCLELSRGFLVDLCDYGKTNQTKPSQATKQIDNNLKKLKAAGIISKYSGLTNNDADRIKISPPKGMYLAAS